MAQRFQNGHLRKAKRKSGAVWEFLFRELGQNGKRVQRTITVGKVKELRTEREALDRIKMLRGNINSGAGSQPALMTFGALARHYCETELLADNKTEMTRSSYRVYLNRWILPKWERDYLHSLKPIPIEQWLRTLSRDDGSPLANGSKAKIRNIMSGIFTHGIRYEITDRNPIKSVRQSAKREHVPVILDVEELHRLFDALELRERAMIVCDALTGIRRSELMGWKWDDVDFLGMQINIRRSMVNQFLSDCKTEASKKPVPMDEHISKMLLAWRQESTYTAPDDWVWASPTMKGKQPLWLGTVLSKRIQPAAREVGITKRIGWHTFRHTFSTLVKSLGVDAKVVQELLRHASFKTTMDGYTQAMADPKRHAQQQVADLIMRTGKVGHA